MGSEMCIRDSLLFIYDAKEGQSFEIIIVMCKQLCSLLVTFSSPSPKPDAGSVAVIDSDVKRRRVACVDCLVAIGEGSGSRIGALFIPCKVILLDRPGAS